MNSPPRISTGLKGLDSILDGLRIGDNVVWNIDSIGDYRFFVGPFVRKALQEGKKIIYMRFGQHPPLVNAGPNVTIYKLDAYRGFESFATRVHAIITSEGRGTFYVFDCLSDLLFAWATDLMIRVAITWCSAKATASWPNMLACASLAGSATTI